MATAQAEAYRPTPRDRPAVLLSNAAVSKAAPPLEAVSKIGCQARSSSNSALASFRSDVSKPSVNQP
jgi:hypothetical protein